jgi:hypothetical protein
MLQEIKGKLAKLLATENLIVEHRNVETAQFDVVRRVLTLPIWNTNSEDVYDLLVAHEVGHALYTDDREWNKDPRWSDVPRSFVNITEDARIEKLMKRRYGGLNKTFYRGYRTLNDKDFFEIGEEDPNEFSFPDRINLYFKIGSYLSIKFTPEEMEIVDLVANAETFDDALDSAKALSSFLKRSSEPQQVPASIPPQSAAPGGEEVVNEKEKEEQEPTDSGDGDDWDDTDSDPNDPAQLDVPSYEQENGHSDEEAETVKSFESNLQNMVNTDEHSVPIYLTLPEMHMNQIVADNKEIHEYVNNFWNKYEEIEDFWSRADSDFVQFKKDSQKEVNYLVKEFECKKSASNYARATTSRTGVLDMSKLHTYKYNEDLFKKVTVVPDGKNHGLVFVLDWSGSMGNVMLSTIKQLYNLIWFCRKTGIPYDVYAFTEEYLYRDQPNDVRYNHLKPKEEDTLYIRDEFCMMNLLTSGVNNRVSEEQLKTIWRIAYSQRHMYGGVPPRLGLSGTPLNEAIMTLHKIIPDFKKRNGVEKVNCVVLTDGEANPCSRIAMVHRNWEAGPDLRPRRVTFNSFLRNKKTGNIVRLSDVWHDFTKILLDDLKSTIPDCNFIGFRILDGGLSGMLASYISNYDEREKARCKWKKERTFTIKNMGYESYFVIASTALSNAVDFQVSEDATKSQIKNAFKKSLSGKKMNKRVLSEFIELVA